MALLNDGPLTAAPGPVRQQTRRPRLGVPRGLRHGTGVFSGTFSGNERTSPFSGNERTHSRVQWLDSLPLACESRRARLRSRCRRRRSQYHLGRSRDVCCEGTKGSAQQGSTGTSRSYYDGTRSRPQLSAPRADGGTEGST
jgi:hypothetical protein